MDAEITPERDRTKPISRRKIADQAKVRARALHDARMREERLAKREENRRRHAEEKKRIAELKAVAARSEGAGLAEHMFKKLRQEMADFKKGFLKGGLVLAENFPALMKNEVDAALAGNEKSRQFLLSLMPRIQLPQIEQTSKNDELKEKAKAALLGSNVVPFENANASNG